MSVIRKLFSREDTTADVAMVRDLDALIAKPVGFRFQGRVYVIPPISTERFLELSEHYAKLDRLEKQRKVTPTELVQAYAELIGSACKEVDEKLVMRMSQSQAAALLQLIIDTMSGRIHTEKKSPVNQAESGSQSKPPSA